MNTVSGLKELCALPDGYGPIVNMCAFEGRLIVAAENGVFSLERGLFGRYRLRRITPIARRRWWQLWRAA